MQKAIYYYFFFCCICNDVLGIMALLLESKPYSYLQK